MVTNKRGAMTRTKILAFLRKNAENKSPSIAEIMEAVGLKSKGATAYQLKVLRDMGAITWKPGKNRTIVLAEEEDVPRPSE